MTRKDYQRIANAFRNGLAGVSRLQESGIEYTAECMANELAADNPRFDKEKFLEACGFGRKRAK